MKYFYVNLKKAFRVFPFALVIAIILFGGLCMAFGALVSAEENSDENQKYYLGIVGEEENSIFNIGISVLQNLDSSQLAIDIKRMDQKQAESALKSGEIAAYAILPDGFMDDALKGNIKSITYVSNPNSIGLDSMFREELTAVISDILASSMQGVYGMNNVIREDYPEIANAEMNSLSLKYTEYIVKKSNMYAVEELGVADRLTFAQYMFCSISVIFICLFLIPFARLYIKNDNALVKLLYSKNHSSPKQVLSEYLSLFLSVLAVFFTIFSVFLLSAQMLGSQNLTGILEQIHPVRFSLHTVAVLFTVTAMAYAVFELSKSLTGGLLAYFFMTIALCYVSGCIYPIYSLPPTLQTISAFLPTGIARSHLAFGMTGESDPLGLLALLCYAVLFMGVSVFARHMKITAKGANV